MTIKIIESNLARRLSPKEKWNILGPYLKQHGRGCLAYSTLQDLDYFIDENRGYIAYSSFKHPLFSRNEKKMVLADPISARKDYQAIIESFLDLNSDSVFLQISRGAAEVLDAYGLQVNQMGIETELNLEGFSAKGASRSKLRQWRNKCLREGVTVEEKSISDVNFFEVRHVSNEWTGRKGGHELLLLTRPLVHEAEKDVRYFWAKQNHKIVGICIFDPMYENQKTIGYYHNFDRMIKNAPNGTGVSCVLEAIKKFKEEGVKVLSLGMSPLSRIEDDLNHSALISRIAKILYTYGNFIYPFKGNESHKNKYDGRREKVYFSCSRGNDLRELICFMKSMKFF